MFDNESDKDGGEEAEEESVTHDNNPTPHPLMILPKTIIPNPFVKVCIAPPIVKTSAPIKRVPFLPIMSPTRPAARDVATRGVSIGIFERRKGY